MSGNGGCWNFQSEFPKSWKFPKFCRIPELSWKFLRHFPECWRNLRHSSYKHNILLQLLPTTNKNRTKLGHGTFSLTITYMMYRLGHRYRKSIISWEISVFLTFEPNSRSESKYFGEIIESIHMVSSRLPNWVSRGWIYKYLKHVFLCMWVIVKFYWDYYNCIDNWKFLFSFYYNCILKLLENDFTGIYAYPGYWKKLIFLFTGALLEL